MKYATKKGYEQEWRIHEVVEIPNPLPSWAPDADAFLAKMFPGVTGWFQLMQDGNGAVEQGNGRFVQPVIPTPEPQPNTEGNPYFGKPAIETKDFYALVGQVLSAARFKRLTTDSHFMWIEKALDHVEYVDPDDKAGQFLQIIAYLTTDERSAALSA